MPRDGEIRASAQLWAWEDFRFGVSVRYPADDRSPQARQAIAQLASFDFDKWKNRWLWRSLPLDEQLLGTPDLADRLLEWAREMFDEVAVAVSSFSRSSRSRLKPTTSPTPRGARTDKATPMIGTLRFHDGRVIGTVALIDGVACLDQPMTDFLGDMKVVDPLSRAPLKHADGEKYIRALQTALENGYFALEINH